MTESQANHAGTERRSIDSGALAKVTGKSMFFGHQSVGFNILDGVTDVLHDAPESTLKLFETIQIGGEAGIYHARIGRNGDPASKIDEFARIVEGGVGGSVDVAFMKLCYVDFRDDTQAEAVFGTYRETMERLQTKYAKTRFVHLTVPLTSRESGPKTLVKGLIGRARRGYEDNVVRERYNRLVRKEYGPNGLVFDLARVESTLPDGRRLEYRLKDETYYALAPEYTSDGGHLNEVGRRYAAAGLLRFLASLE